MTEYEVQFTKMSDATTEEISYVFQTAQAALTANLVDELFTMLRALKGEHFGYRVDRYEHSLQTATRAMRDGARIDMIVAALLHDIGDAIAPANHSRLAAAVLEPYVDDETAWVVGHHGVFQSYHYGEALGIGPDGREKYRDNPYFDACAAFCADWDQVAFDPGYDTQPLETFEPMVREVFGREPKAFM
jgi:predicted HD phosphohydrolase